MWCVMRASVSQRFGEFFNIESCYNDEIKWKCMVFGMYFKGERRKQKGTKTKTNKLHHVMLLNNQCF